jgi:hypothetical protein
MRVANFDEDILPIFQTSGVIAFHLPNLKIDNDGGMAGTREFSRLFQLLNPATIPNAELFSAGKKERHVRVRSWT